MRILTILAITLLLISCRRNSIPVEHNSLEQIVSGNGIFYWKTEFKLSQWEIDFLHENYIKRLYLRLFDVDVDIEEKMPVPIATTRFTDSVPDGIEVVPVVYITTSVLKNGQLKDYTSKLYKRVLAMVKKNDLGRIRELQLDCDWTGSTEQVYFDFCKEIVNMAAKDSIIVSSTIRLHQLKKKAPPVNYGVLMLYNTGSIYNPTTENSILHGKDVEPYLRTDISYPIPLSFSYPTYAWGILLRENKFVSILHKTDFSDKEFYQDQGDNRFKVVKEHYVENKQLLPGDVVRLERSQIDEIMSVKALVNNKICAPQSTIIYHLDSLNLSSYTHQEICNIYK